MNPGIFFINLNLEPNQIDHGRSRLPSDSSEGESSTCGERSQDHLRPLENFQAAWLLRWQQEGWRRRDAHWPQWSWMRGLKGRSPMLDGQMGWRLFWKPQFRWVLKGHQRGAIRGQISCRRCCLCQVRCCWRWYHQSWWSQGQWIQRWAAPKIPVGWDDRGGDLQWVPPGLRR